MAKYNPNKSSNTKSKIEYPSEFGSHTSMIDHDYAEVNDDDSEFVVCKDGRGSYLTSRSNLDNNLCDYNRSANTEKRESILDEYTGVVTTQNGE
jgi:hypothetical protein